MITHPNGRTEHDQFLPKWKSLLTDEFLYRYLLANTALKAFDDGMEDEQQKVLKHFGVNYWEPGMDEVMFNGTRYKVVDSDLWLVDSQKPYN